MNVETVHVADYVLSLNSIPRDCVVTICTHANFNEAGYVQEMDFEGSVNVMAFVRLYDVRGKETR